jgi:hypothetical protein
LYLGAGMSVLDLASDVNMIRLYLMSAKQAKFGYVREGSTTCHPF